MRQGQKFDLTRERHLRRHRSAPLNFFGRFISVAQVQLRLLATSRAFLLTSPRALIICAVVSVTLTSQAHAGPSDMLEALRQSAAALDISGHVKTWLALAYDRAPALVLVLGALFVMPMTALLAYSAMTVRGSLPRDALRSWRGPNTASYKTAERAASAGVTVAAWPTTAWLTAVDGHKYALSPKTALVRIGRHEDNDILLTEPSVHRHHAIVHRTTDGGYTITDLSGGSGNGVSVNGLRVAQAQLENGSVVDLGAARLTFECTLV
jgi:FHA domain